MIDEFGTAAELPMESVVTVPVERLALDRFNPRLIGSNREMTDEQIIVRLYTGEDLSELLQSISANGYLDIEPLIVAEEGDYLTVLEGNRRLGAIRLFREPDLAERVFEEEGSGFPFQHFRNADGTVSTKFRSTGWRTEKTHDLLLGLNTLMASQNGGLMPRLFLRQWYPDGGVSLKEIAKMVGDQHNTVKRMVNAIYVLEQAEKENVFHLEDRMIPSYNFSHLYTALSRASYMKFLGLDPAWSKYDPNPEPVPKENLRELGEVLRWIYGSRENEIRPVVGSQNPDIEYLGEVLESDEGLGILRGGGPLSEAHASTISVGRRFSEALLRARREGREAINNLRGFDIQEGHLVAVAEDILETVQALHGRMKEKVQRTEKANE